MSESRQNPKKVAENHALGGQNDVHRVVKQPLMGKTPIHRRVLAWLYGQKAQLFAPTPY
jgi:hypothetical protein